MTLGEAWSLWLDGRIDPNQLLWGVELFWWERIGKAMQLVAGATILVEIIGAPALRRFAYALRGRISLAGLYRNAVDHFHWLSMSWRFIFLTEPGSEEEKRLQRETQSYKADAISFLLGWLIVMIGSHYIELPWNSVWLDLIAGLFALFVAAAIVAPLLVLAAILILSALGALLAVGVIHPIAWLLERESLDRLVKLFAFLMLVAGFHFDFLAS